MYSVLHQTLFEPYINDNSGYNGYWTICVRPELQSRVNNGCIVFVQSPLSPIVIDDQSRTDSVKRE